MVINILVISDLYSETEIFTDIYIHRHSVIALNNSEGTKQLYKKGAPFGLHRAVSCIWWVWTKMFRIVLDTFQLIVGVCDK